MKELYVDEIPNYCCDCPCHNGENGNCGITGDCTDEKRPFDCPLKSLANHDTEIRTQLFEFLREKGYLNIEEFAMQSVKEKIENHFKE